MCVSVYVLYGNVSESRVLVLGPNSTISCDKTFVANAANRICREVCIPMPYNTKYYSTTHMDV